jgi:glycine/D-amino acid oxidase-like deaminating enzyme
VRDSNIGIRTYDIAVIGAGVFGAWIAYRFAQTGRSVALLDAHGAANPRSSSGAESRILRAGYGAHHLYTRMASESLEWWRRLDADAHVFLNTGVLWLSRPGNALLAASREALRNVGAIFEELDAAGVRRRFPQMCVADHVQAILEVDAGVLLAKRAVLAVVEAARALGVELRHETARACVDAAVKTESGSTISAGAYVYACGSWLPKLFPAVGPLIRPTRQPLFFFRVPTGNSSFEAAAMPAWIDETDARMPYGIPDIGGGAVKMGFHRLGQPFDPDAGDRIVTPGEIDEAREYLAMRFPALGGAELTSSRICPYENTQSGDFLIDRHPEVANVWLVGGGSGHGFKHGPAVADYVVKRFEGLISEEPRFALRNHSERVARAVL